jgi:hypothetical protein
MEDDAVSSKDELTKAVRSSSMDGSAIDHDVGWDFGIPIIIIIIIIYFRIMMLIGIPRYPCIWSAMCLGMSRKSPAVSKET